MRTKKSLAQVLHEVDPGLMIVSGHSYHRKKGHSGPEDFDQARGISCSNCGREVFRAKGDLCLGCWEKSNEFEIRDKTGACLELLPLSVIMEIARKPPGEEVIVQE